MKVYAVFWIKYHRLEAICASEERAMAEIEKLARARAGRGKPVSKRAYAEYEVEEMDALE